jgi:hypothetical protein
MKIIRPIHPLCSSLAFSNIAQPNALWLVDTSYAKGAIVRVGECGAILYESLTASNVGNDPETSPTDWLPVGVSNYFAMFDDQNGTQTTNAEEINVVVDFTKLVNSVALMNCEATDVTFQMWDSTQDWTIDTPVIEYDISLRDYGVSSWYDYATYEVVDLRALTKFDLPTFASGTGRMILRAPGGTAKLGSLVYGSAVTLGESLYGASVGIKDYSTKEIDIFGNYQIIEREYKDTVSAKVFVKNANTRAVKQLLADYRTRPLVWAASDNFEVTIIYGFYKSFNLDITSPAGSNLSLQLESI